VPAQQHSGEKEKGAAYVFGEIEPDRSYSSPDTELSVVVQDTGRLSVFERAVSSGRGGSDASVSVGRACMMAPSHVILLPVLYEWLPRERHMGKWMCDARAAV